MSAIDEMSAAAFNGYEGSENYEDQFDNDLFDGFDLRKAGTAVKQSPGARVPKQVPATFNVTINGTGNAASHVFELFNFQNSIEKFYNGATNPTLIPLGAARNNQVRNDAGTGIAQLYAYGGILVNPLGTGVQDGVYFNQAGDLVYNYNVATSDNVTISCKEIPYRSLMTYMGQYAMHVNKMRINYSIAAQITEDFTLTYKNFLGTVKNSSISPQQFFTPTQFQSLLVDVPTPFSITSERGMQMTLLANSKMSITFFVDKYTVPVL
jgi:hypothetical protein